MKIDVEKSPSGITQIVLEGRLDLAGTDEIETKFENHTTTSKAAVLVDLSKVEIIVSIGIRLLVMSGKALSRRGGKMALYRPTSMVEEVLKTSGIDKLIPIFQDYDGACQYLAEAID